MDNNYVDKMIGNFITDYGFEESYKDEFYSFIKDELKGLREEDNELYEEIFKYSKFEQGNLIYDVLLRKVENDGLVEENISDMFGMMLDSNIIQGMLTFFAGSLAVGGIFGTERGRKMLKNSGEKITNSLDRIKKVYWTEREIRKSIEDSVIRSNFNDCNNKCDIDPSLKDSLKTKALFSLRKSEAPHEKLSRGSADALLNQQSAKCLLNCYLDYITNVYAQLVVAFKKCVEKTGEEMSFDQSSGSALTVLSKYPVGTECQSFHDEIMTIYQHIYKIIDFMFEDQRDKKRDWLNKMDKKVSMALQGQDIQQIVSDYS